MDKNKALVLQEEKGVSVIEEYNVFISLTYFLSLNIVKKCDPVDERIQIKKIIINDNLQKRKYTT